MTDRIYSSDSAVCYDYNDDKKDTAISSGDDNHASKQGLATEPVCDSGMQSEPLSSDLIEEFEIIPVEEVKKGESNLKSVTNDEVRRAIITGGKSGTFVIQLCEGWKTLPETTKAGFKTNASRTLMRMKNISLLRGVATDENLREVMVGPNHYFGTLVKTHQYVYQIEINNGFPTFISSDKPSPDFSEQGTLQAPKSDEVYQIKLDSEHKWCSGKKTQCANDLKDQIKDRKSAASLTAHLGVLTLPDDCVILPEVEATKVDLSSFGSRLVKNDQPFILTKGPEDPMDVVTYHFGLDYANYQIRSGNGVFLETHDFTQIMTPLTPNSSGFITLGRIVEDKEEKRLELIGIKVPFGYSIVVDKGCIHGDTTFTGEYAMAMTVDHNTMASADVVFLRNKGGKNVTIHSMMPMAEQMVQGKLNDDDERLRPIAVPTSGYDWVISALKRGAKKRIGDIPKKGSVVSRVVTNPMSTSWLKALFKGLVG
ncbi:hypothetical protein JQC92_05575 [Shewanella sp. 202IG2-18]|uniref:hypothetical protein n=1 Tax=Parashewanella hymeniacidonis TaxID=2807618 RepID=UPI00195FAB42|nr:hypothetical protein [Parashewanella hymeniacidonis]MBM7071508.1 hypothetical protein [Parashewanella hymeniacidonis]